MLTQVQNIVEAGKELSISLQCMTNVLPMTHHILSLDDFVNCPKSVI